ncbi:unnamed protein product [Caenorhabditis nigoni]
MASRLTVSRNAGGTKKKVALQKRKKILLGSFENNSFPSKAIVGKLSERTGQTTTQVRKWFVAQRAKVYRTTADSSQLPQQMRILDEVYKQKEYIDLTEMKEIMERTGASRHSILKNMRGRRMADRKAGKQMIDERRVPKFPSREKKIRVVTDEQKAVLEKFFETNQFPSKDQISGIFVNGELSNEEVINWFSGERQRARKLNKSGIATLPSQMQLLNEAYKANKFPDFAALSEKTEICPQSLKSHFARRRQADKKRVRFDLKNIQIKEVSRYIRS